MLLPNRLFQKTPLPDIWTTLQNPPISVNLIDLDLQWKIANSKDLDTEAIEAINILLDKGPSNLQRDLGDWTTEEFEGKNVLFFQGKNYIPKNYELWQEITSQFHDRVTAGHPGEIETLNAIKEHYWWPGMRAFIKNYVKGCGTCQQFKINQNPSNPSYILIPGPMNTRPFANCSMDMIMDLPPVTLENGMIINAVMVMVDHGLAKGVVLTPCTKNFDTRRSRRHLTQPCL